MGFSGSSYYEVNVSITFNQSVSNMSANLATKNRLQCLFQSRNDCDALRWKGDKRQYSAALKMMYLLPPRMALEKFQPMARSNYSTY